MDREKENIGAVERPPLKSRATVSALSPVNEKLRSPLRTSKLAENKGIIDFSLSPKRQRNHYQSNAPESPGRNRLMMKIPVSVEIEKKKNITYSSVSIERKESLVELYAAKHRKLNELEAEVNKVRFEMNEISCQLLLVLGENGVQHTIKEECSHVNKTPDVTPIESQMLSKESFSEEIPVHRRPPISVPHNLNPSRSINNIANYINKIQGQISHPQINSPGLKGFVEDFKSKLDSNENDLKKFLNNHSTEIDGLKTKTSRFMLDLFTNSKSKSTEENNRSLDNSFDFCTIPEELDDLSSVSLVLSDDESEISRN